MSIAHWPDWAKTPKVIAPLYDLIPKYTHTISAAQLKADWQQVIDGFNNPPWFREADSQKLARSRGEDL